LTSAEGDVVGFEIRIINGNSGGGIAVKQHDGKEQKLAVFPDSHVEDFAKFENQFCVLVSRKRGIAFLDLELMAISKRFQLSHGVENVIISPNGKFAICYRCQELTLTVLRLPDLEEIKVYNLAQRRDDGAYNLIYKTQEELKNDNIRFDNIPIGEAPLRRIRISKNVCPKFTSDGKLIVPVEYFENELEYEIGPKSSTCNPTSYKFNKFTIGIGEINFNTETFNFKAIRQVSEYRLDTDFCVRAISDDGTKIILHSSHLIPATTGQEVQNKFGLKKVFGRRQSISWGYGMEVWNITNSQPSLDKIIHYQNFDDNTLMHSTTLKMFDHEKADFKYAIDLLIPGLIAVLSGRKIEWENSSEKRKEDVFYTPGETGQEIPSYQYPYWRVSDPLLFGDVMRQLLSIHPSFPQNLPWADFTNRQKHFIKFLIEAWGFHAKGPIMSLTWIDDLDRLLILGRDGTLREISINEGSGPACLIENRPTTLNSLDWQNKDADLIYLGSRKFAVSYYATNFQFELPDNSSFGANQISITKTLSVRIITDRELHQKEVKAMDRLVNAIRPGHIKIRSLAAKDVVSGINQLAEDLRNNYSQIIVDNRWVPTLWVKGKPIEEQGICNILCDDASKESAAALENLLTSYLQCTSGKIQDAWHLDDETPTMGSVAISLLKILNPVPAVVMEFIEQRDIDHEDWFYEAFDNLGIESRQTTPDDLLPIRVRLAIQAMSRGYLNKFFELFGLNNDLVKMNSNPALASEYAQEIIKQTSRQWPKTPIDRSMYAANVISTIKASLDNNNFGERTLKDLLEEYR